VFLSIIVILISSIKRLHRSQASRQVRCSTHTYDCEIYRAELLSLTLKKLQITEIFTVAWGIYTYTVINKVENGLNMDSITVNKGN
jgi:hypothetical protein